MNERLASPVQITAMLDACSVVLKDCGVLRHLNDNPNYTQYVFGIYDQDVGDAIKHQMHMTTNIAEAQATRWTFGVGQARGEDQPEFEQALPYDYLFSLRCDADRASGIRQSRQMWLPLNSRGDVPRLHQVLDAMYIDFSDIGLADFKQARSNGHASDFAQAYVDKLEQQDPQYATYVAEVLHKGGSTRREVVPEHMTQEARHQKARANIAGDLLRIVGSLSLEKQLASAPR